MGCGTGRLARELRRVVPCVTGIDRDEQSIAAARARDVAGDIEYRCGDFLDLPLRPGGFGLITAVASLHHMDAAAALNRMREQLRPGGTLVIIGLARNGWSPVDLAFEVPAAVNLRIQRVRHRPRPRPDGGSTSRPSSGRRPRPTGRSAASRARCCPACGTGVTCSGATRSAG